MEGVCTTSLISFCVQMIVLLAIVIASIINLSLHQEHREIWISLLSTCIGLIFPNPKVKKDVRLP